MSKILVISPTPSHPQDAGNRARIFSLLSALRAAGHEVYFGFIKMEVGDEGAMADAWDGYFSIIYRRPANRWVKQKYDRWAKRFGKDWVLPYRIDEWYAPEVSQQIESIRERVQPEVVLVEYVFFSKVFECFGPNTLKILDTHDVFSGRHLLYKKHGIKPVFFYTTKQEEKRALERADLVLAIQDKEMVYFSKLTQRKVVTVGHLAQTTDVNETFGGALNRLLFVGSGNHINVDGLCWFIEAVFPLLQQAIPEIELDVVGQCATKISVCSGVNLLGPVLDLTPYYQRANVVINPLRFGTGLKIKTIEALAHGKPLVTTSVGSVGLEDAAGEAFLVADAPETFANSVIQLLRSPKLSSEFSVKSLQYTQNYNKNAIAPLLEEISRAVSQV